MTDPATSSDATDAAQTGQEPSEAPEADETAAGAQEGAEEGGETFTADYVAKLRKEAGDHRVKRREAEQQVSTLRERLIDTTVRSAAGDVLADPGDLLLHTDETDLLDDDGLPDADKIVDAAKALASERPHLASRRPARPVEQGARDEQTPDVSLSGILRSRAG